MVSAADHVGMTAFLIIVAIAAFFALAGLYGTDSTPVERGFHRPNWR